MSKVVKVWAHKKNTKYRRRRRSKYDSDSASDSASGGDMDSRDYDADLDQPLKRECRSAMIDRYFSRILSSGCVKYQPVG